MNSVWDVKVDLAPAYAKQKAIAHAAGLALMEMAIKLGVNVIGHCIEFKTQNTTTTIAVPADSREVAVEAAKNAFYDREVFILEVSERK